jgi:alkaline phosphatase
MKIIQILIATLFIINVCFGQTTNYSIKFSTSNAHSHNDYENQNPFFTAYNNNFGSIEADIFYIQDSLYVGHVLGDIAKKRTLQNYYLDPLNKKIKENSGFIYKDSSKVLQLLIDIKTDPYRTLERLVAVLNQYPNITKCNKIKIVITGGRPKPNEFKNYPEFIYFDGDLEKKYLSTELNRIGLFSADFTQYSVWNGKGIMVKEEKQKIDSIISSVHSLGKQIRFYGSPDYLNAWQQFVKMKVDFINTDHIVELAKFFNAWEKNNVTLSQKQVTYTPSYKNDGVNGPVKNIILLIGDGCSLPQWYAGYTANGGSLTTFNLKHIGFSKTSSADNYVTDSAPGASAWSTGEKIENRHLGITPEGKNLPLITDYLAAKKYSIGVISSGDVSDATPAAFYAHEKERDSSIEIIQQLNNSTIQILAGAGNDKINNVKILQKKKSTELNHQTLDSLLPNYKIINSIKDLNTASSSKTLVIDKQAGLSMQEGRGAWLSTAFEKITQSLTTKSNKPFFLMAEAAQIDYGGHDNNIAYVVKEVLDFDALISKAIQYADTHKGTLVIITGDHETGGLTLHDGNYKTQTVSGQFATNDHTGIPVPVYAYGYRSYLFDGVYENTAIFNKIKEAIK